MQRIRDMVIADIASLGTRFHQPLPTPCPFWRFFVWCFGTESHRPTACVPLRPLQNRCPFELRRRAGPQFVTDPAVRNHTTSEHGTAGRSVGWPSLPSPDAAAMLRFLRQRLSDSNRGRRHGTLQLTLLWGSTTCPMFRRIAGRGAVVPRSPRRSPIMPILTTDDMCRKTFRMA